MLMHFKAVSFMPLGVVPLVNLLSNQLIHARTPQSNPIPPIESNYWKGLISYLQVGRATSTRRAGFYEW